MLLPPSSSIRFRLSLSGDAVCVCLMSDRLPGVLSCGVFGRIQERLLIADMAISSCEFMFEETRNYVLQRKAFGKTIAHLQVWGTLTTEAICTCIILQLCRRPDGQ